jgi:hypothetical protein
MGHQITDAIGSSAAGAEQILLSLRALPSFEAFTRSHSFDGGANQDRFRGSVSRGGTRAGEGFESDRRPSAHVWETHFAFFRQV